MVTETQRRQVYASFGVFWVYAVAQSESDFGAASSALAFFQRTWPSTRAALLAFFGSSAESVLPSGLPVTGAWTADTRDAVSLTIQGILGGEVWTDAEYNALPTTAGGIGSWFNNRFDNLVQSSADEATLDLLWDFEGVLDEGASRLPASLQSLTAQVLSGVVFGEPSVIAAGNDPAREIIDRTSTNGAREAAVDAATDDAGTAITAGGTDIPEDLIMPVKGRRATASSWQYLVIGAGALAFGGLAYWFYLQNKRKAA
jgi:hypothetical protein